MDNIIIRLNKTLGVKCVSTPEDDVDASLRRSMSMLAYSSFDFRAVELLDERILVAKPREDFAPAHLMRLLDEVDAASSYPVVCSLQSVTSYLRSLLLRERRGFITDDGQAFIPGFLRLASKHRLRRTSAPEPWGPTERQAFIHLLGHIDEDVTAASLREATGVSATSATRALTKIAAIAPIEKAIGGSTGRANIWHVTDVEAFVERGTAAFGDPVRKRFFAKSADLIGTPLAGLSALASRSLLAPPHTEQRACGIARAKELHAVDPYETAAPTSEVIVLSYNPAPFVENGLVDLYTMIKTVDRTNERVDSAVEEATEGRPWLRLA